MEKGCRNCMWLYHMVTHNPTAPCSECLDYNKWQTTKQTNADRIRSMTDEELAEWMANKVDCQYCSVRSEWCTESEASCRTNWLDWLKKEAKE